ncbi:MAG: bile acid:sodium symporter family protein [Allosphingosinicella sp.]
MNAASLIVLAVVASIMLIVFSLGAKAQVEDVWYLFTRPKALARAVIAIFIIVPAFAMALCFLFPLPPYARFGLVAMAVSPLPPILPFKEMKVGGDRRYALGLLVAASVLALVMTPLLIEIGYQLVDTPDRIGLTAIVKPLIMTIALPLGAGMATRRFAPGISEGLSGYALSIGTVLLVLGLGLILFHEWRAIIALVGDGTVLAFAATVLVGVVAGHLLGGRHEGDSAALALAASTRHPAIAIAIASTGFPGDQGTARAAVLLFLLTNLVVTLPYVLWAIRRNRQRASHVEAG